MHGVYGQTTILDCIFHLVKFALFSVYIMITLVTMLCSFLADHFELLGLSVAGVFTVAGIIDAFVYHGQRAIRKKIDLGKQT